VNDPGFIRIR
jgi:hypothetical protein